ncbi:recombinase RecT [Orenia marismortui]|uniref:Recombination protein RecT n=1 Tax=Orenia marismortui TaxID=46469 RepID=A0A4R8H8N0_9FIRM|nr:recombinase RecT [Orenia marismortui]TDX52162.1 recombination protein RecT [Orenia marismortui]
MSNLAMVKKDVIDVVSDKVAEFKQKGELDLPKNYSPENAMKSAWLILQETETKSKKPVLQECSQDSIANSLLKMVTLGLNPAKNQGYFIPYGKQLTFQPSYFGNIAIAKRVANAESVDAQVIYKGDELEYENVNGRTKIVNHKQTFESKMNGEVTGAYAVIKFKDERPNDAEIMTMKELEAAWSQGYGKSDTHKKFTGEMAKKTVINRLCKPYINSSNDSSLFVDAYNDSRNTKAEQEAQEEIEENANSQVIDIELEEQDQEESEAIVEDVPEEELQPTGTEGPDF